MTITALPAAPQPTDSQAVFNTKAFAWVAALGTWTTEANALTAVVSAEAATAVASANAVAADRILAQSALASITAQSPAANAASAAASAAAAAVSAAQAQAVSPDSPVRFNTRRIEAALTIPSAYNAGSTGPIAIADGVTVTIQDHATWSIQ